MYKRVQMNVLLSPFFIVAILARGGEKESEMEMVNRGCVR